MERNKNKLIHQALEDESIILLNPNNRIDRTFKPITGENNPEYIFFKGYLDRLFKDDPNVRNLLKQQDETKMNYSLRTVELDSETYKNNYAMAPLFGITNQKDWDKMFFEDNKSKLSLIVLEPNLTYADELKSSDKTRMIHKYKNTWGIINQGDQFTIVELESKLRKIDSEYLPRYIIKDIIDTFKKPTELLERNNGLAFTKTNSVKIIQPIYTIGKDGKKRIDNEDYYEILKNFYLGTVKTMKYDFTDKIEKVSHINRIIASNKQTIDSVSSVAFLTGQSVMGALGMSLGSYYNENSENLVFNSSMMESTFMPGSSITFYKNKNSKASIDNIALTNIYSFFNLNGKKDSNINQQKEIIKNIILNKDNIISFNDNYGAGYVDLYSLITEYKKEVASILKNEASYYYINSKKFDTSLNFSNPSYNLNFNLKKHFENNQISNKRLVESYMLKKDKINSNFFDFVIGTDYINDYADKNKNATYIKKLSDFFSKRNINGMSAKEMFNYVGTSKNLSTDDKLQFATFIDSFFKNEYAISYGFKDYKDLIENANFSNLNPLNIDRDFVFGLLNNNELLNSFLSTSKQSANIRGKMMNISQSFIDILGHQNVIGQRASQGGDKFSGAILNLDNGVNLNFGSIVSSWQRYEKHLNTKVENTNYTSLKNTLSNFYQEATGNNDFSPNLFNNYNTILYTNSDYAFQDSDLTSSLLAMKNTSMYDNKNLFISYDSIDTKFIEEINNVFGIDSAGGFYDRLSNFDESKITDELSFEYYFLNRMLGEENFKKYVDARYDENGLSKNIAKEFELIGSEISKITNVQTIDDKKRLISAIDDSINKYNSFVDRYMIRTNPGSKITNIIGEDFLYKGHNLGITSSNTAFIEGISFGSDGIRIKTKGLVLNSQGVKMMFDNIKATNLRSSHMISLVDNGYSYIIDAIVNEKMTKGKRGFNGTFYGRSILTMALHGINQEFVNGKALSSEERFNKFLNIMKNESSFNLHGKETNVFDLLGINLSYKDNVLSIGEIDKMTSSFSIRLNNIDNLATAQDYLIQKSNQRLKEVLGRMPNTSDAEYLGALITNKLYSAYNVYRSQLTDESQKQSKIFFESGNSYLERSYAETINGTKEFGISKIHDIDVGGAYRLFSFTHMMKESKSLEVDEALKLGRLSNIVLSENGLNWIGEEIGTAIAGKNSSKLIQDIALLPNNVGVQLFGEEKYNILVENLFQNKINLNEIDSINSNNAYKFLTKTTLGKILDYSNEKNKLNKPLYGMLSNFNSSLQSELTHFYNTVSTPESALDVSIEYLLRGLNNEKLNQIYNKYKYNDKIKAVDNLIGTSRDILKKQLIKSLYDSDTGTFKRIDYNNSDLASVMIEVFGSTLDKYSKDLINPENNNILSNFIGFYNQFVVSNQNLLENDFALNEFKFEYNDIRHLNEYYRAIHKNDRLNFGYLLNRYSGEKLINFNNIADIAKNGIMKFKISSFAVGGNGEIVFNSEINNISNIIRNNKRLNYLKESIQGLEDLPYASLDPYNKMYNKLYYMTESLKKENKNSKYINLLNSEIIPDFSKMLVYIGNEEALKKYKLFQSKLEFFINNFNRPETKLYSMEHRTADYKFISNYIKEVVNMEDSAKESLNVLNDKIYKVLTDKEKARVILNSFNFDDFYRELLNSKTFKTKQNNPFFIKTQDFINTINLNYNNGQIITSTSNISRSILDSDGILTITNDNKFLNFLNTIYKHDGELNEYLSFEDISKFVFDLNNSMKLDSNEDSKVITKEFINRTVDFIKESYINNYLLNEKSGLKNGYNSILLYNKLSSIIKSNYENEVASITTSTINAITNYAPEAQMLDKITYFQPKASAAIQGTEGSSIYYHIKNSFQELIDLDPNSDIYTKKKKEFTKAMTLLYGDFRYKKINSMIESKNIEGLDRFLESMSGVILGTEEEFMKNKSLYKTFGKRKYTYGFSSRHPHQYIGSIRASRFVKLNEEDRNLSFFKTFMGSEAQIRNNASAFMFIGKRTALGMNGDFDGDRYQLFKLIANDFKYSSEDKYLLEKKADLDARINYMLNDLSAEDLKIPFTTHLTMNEEKNELYKLIRNRAFLDNIEIKNGSDAYKFIEDRYKALKFEYLRAQDVMLDENSQHAALPTLKDLVIKFNNGKTDQISRADFAEFILSLNNEQKQALLYRLIGQEDYDKLDQIFDWNISDKSLIKKIREFQKNNINYKNNNIYELLNDLTKQITKGNLKFNNLWLADTGYEAYTGIHRTGPVHSLLTSFRETGVAISQVEVFEKIIKQIIENNNTELTPEQILGGYKTIGRLEPVKELMSKSRYFNTFGTMIEKLSISSKLGGGADPYINLYQLRRTENAISSYKDKMRIEKMFNFDGMLNFFKEITDNMNGDYTEYNGNKISSINDIINIVFTNSEEADEKILNEVKKALAVIINKDFNKIGYDNENLKLSNVNLIAAFSNISQIIGKSFIDNTLSLIDENKEGKIITQKYDFFDKLRKKLDEKGLLYNIIKYFDKNSKDAGVRFETALRPKIIEAVERAIDRQKDIVAEKAVIDATKQVNEVKTISDNIKIMNEEIIKAIKEETEFDSSKKEQISKINNIIKEIIESDKSGKNNSIPEEISKNLEEVNNIVKEIYEEKDIAISNSEDIVDAEPQIIKNTSNIESSDSKEIKELKEKLNEARKEIENLKNQISNHNLVNNGVDEIKDQNKKLISQIKSLEKLLDENEVKTDLKIEEAGKNIEILKNKLEKQQAKYQEVREKLSEIIKNKDDEITAVSKKILELNEQIESLKKENVALLSAAQKTTKNKAASETIVNATTEITNSLKKHKKMLTIGGSIAALGLFFRIFQSNRSVVELDINQEQYEKTKGSLYRTLGNYNINTNIRSFY